MGLSPREGILVGIYMVSVGQTMDCQTSSLVEPLQPPASGLQGVELWSMPGGGVIERDSPSYKRGKGVQAEGYCSVEVGYQAIHHGVGGKLKSSMT